jgi:hypothetical protein
VWSGVPRPSVIGARDRAANPPEAKRWQDLDPRRTSARSGMLHPARRLSRGLDASPSGMDSSPGSGDCQIEQPSVLPTTGHNGADPSGAGADRNAGADARVGPSAQDGADGPDRPGRHEGRPPGVGARSAELDRQESVRSGGRATPGRDIGGRVAAAAHRCAASSPS